MPSYDTPSAAAYSGKACHPLGPCLYLKQAEESARWPPDSPAASRQWAAQVLKHQPAACGEHFASCRTSTTSRITVVIQDLTIAEVIGHDLSISGIRNELSVIADFGQYDLRVNPNNENELFLPDARAAGNLLVREKLPTPQGTSFPRPNQFHAHGYVNEINDAVECVLELDRAPQSGPMLAWDTLAVLMAGYESSEAGGRFVEMQPYRAAREFLAGELPDPRRFGSVFQRKS